MARKDCDNSRGSGRALRFLLRAACCALVVAPPAVAATVRVRPHALVIADEIRAADVCDFVDFAPGDRAGLLDVRLGSSPRPGETQIVPVQAIREALRRADLNFANVALIGATSCVVSRAMTRGDASLRAPAKLNGAGPARAQARAAAADGLPDAGRTLRDVIYDHVARALERFEGRPVIEFDSRDAEALALAEESRGFAVTTRTGVSIGLVPVDVEITGDDREVRKLSLITRVSLMRDVLVARRPINQSATLGSNDVERRSLAFTRADRQLGITDTGRVFGMRARRFIAAGTTLQRNLLEDVPLVSRGQLVKLQSREGGITVVTTGKAVQGGMLGEIITVRAMDRERMQFEATIVGPGVVQLGDVRSERFADSGEEPS